MREDAKRMLQMAQEWANELSRFKGHELLVAEVAGWGFQEVMRGRNSDAVLKEVLAKIENGIGPIIDLAPASEPDAGHEDEQAIDPKSS